MLKVIDVARLSNDALRDLVHPRRRRATPSSLFCAALREAELRASGGLDFDKSFKVIEKASRERGVVAYREIVDASGAQWGAVFGQVEGHLSRLAIYARERGWPTPSAVVVRENVATATAPEPLDGLLEAAKAFGYAAPNENPFLREQQAKLAQWAQTRIEEDAPPAPSASPPAPQPRTP